MTTTLTTLDAVLQEASTEWSDDVTEIVVLLASG
jgi:hypothetical protein